MEYLKSLLLKTSVSGFEDSLREFLIEELKRFNFEVSITPLGNICAIKKGKGNFSILYDAHYDQIGFVIQKIQKNGIIRIKSMGGNDPRVLLGTEMTILGKEEIKGVIATVPPHLSSVEERKKIPPIETMYLDTGLSYDYLKQVVKVGDPIIFKRKIKIINNFIIGPGIDNRAGVYTLLKLAEWLKDKEIENSIIIRITVQEEVGIRGAQNKTLYPFDLAVIVDATFASQHLASNDRTFKMEKGPTLMFGPNYSTEYSKKLEFLANERNIPTQREIEETVRGTNAYAYAVMNGGKPLIGISYPIYNMHTPSEIISKEVLEHTVELLKITAQFKGEDK